MFENCILNQSFTQVGNCVDSSPINILKCYADVAWCQMIVNGGKVAEA